MRYTIRCALVAIILILGVIYVTPGYTGPTTADTKNPKDPPPVMRPVAQPRCFPTGTMFNPSFNMCSDWTPAMGET